MDPITTAILAALASGVIVRTAEVGTRVIIDAYEALKGAIKAKCGASSKVVQAVAELEQQPDSRACQAIVAEEMTNAKLTADPELVKLAQALIEALKSTAEGQETVSKYHIEGGQVGIIGDNAHIEGGIHFHGPAGVIGNHTHIEGDIRSGDFDRVYPPVFRYSDLSFPDHTTMRQIEVLRVAITCESVSERASELALEPSSDAGEPMKVDACLVVSPLDFDLKSHNVQTIEVPLDADSSPVIFRLVPKSIGQKTIAVEFFQNARYLGRAVVETTVNETARESHLVSAQATLGFSSSQLPPDLTILFDRVSVGESKHYYRYRLLSYKRRLNLWFDEFHTSETTATPQSILEETFAHLNRMHSEDVGDESLFFERLNSIGTSLYSHLFPDDLKALYWNKLRDHVKSIVIISYEPWMPWELVRPFHPETKQAEDGFLCEKFDLTRWLHGAAPPDTISLERLGLIVATSGLELAASEAEEIRQLFGDRAEDVSAAGEAIFQLFKTGGFSGLHFACHGEYNARDPDWSTLYLEEETTLCPIDIDGDKLVFGKDHPLVFLNACETDKGGYALTGMGGWAEAFVRRAQSSGFIGSTWEANSESAYKFAVEFYRHLLDGKTIAEAARLARQSIKRAGDPTWLSYTVYANPLARLNSEMRY
jgi:hypothetical protein